MNFRGELDKLDSLSSIHVTLDLPLCMEALELYLDANQYANREIAEELGISERKLRAVREWLILLGLLETVKGKSVPTPEAALYRRLYDLDPDPFLELLYYRLCTRNRLFSGLVNVFLADRVRKYGHPAFRRTDGLQWFLSFFLEDRSENDLRECFQRFFSPMVRMEDGFGPLTLLEEHGDEYIVRPHTPHPLVQAFVLYDQAAGRASIPLEDVVDGFNSLGRIFFLDRYSVMACLLRLEAQGFAIVDTTAGINQVALVAGRTPRSILEELTEG